MSAGDSRRSGPEGRRSEPQPADTRDGAGLEIWERIARLEGGIRDPFADPYGPTPHCFSSNDVVRMFSLGAQAADVNHLSQCAPCRERVNRYASVTSQELLVPGRAAGRWLPRIADRLARRPPPRKTAPVLMHVPDVIGVASGTHAVGKVRVQLLADPAADLQDRQFELAGAVNATAGRVLVGEGEAFPWVEFDNAVLSVQAVNALRRHRRITDRILLSGEAPARDAVVGTSDIELRRG